MTGVTHYAAKRIGKHGSGFLEGYSVLGQITYGLAGVPLEVQRHFIAILAETKAGCAGGQCAICGNDAVTARPCGPLAWKGTGSTLEVRTGLTGVLCTEL